METQSWITHQRDVDAAQVLIDLILVRAVCGQHCTLFLIRWWSVLFVGQNDVAGAYERFEIAKTARRNRFASEIPETVSEQCAARHADELVPPIMIFVQIIPEQLQFT